MDSLVGNQLAKYQVVSLIREEGGSIVYRAQDLLLARPVTLRVIPHSTAQQPGLRENLIRELLPAARLNHPSIATFYTYGELDGTLILVSEFVPGHTLKDLLGRLRSQSQVVRVDEALYLAGLALDALAYAHSNGTVHGQIKPTKLHVKRLDRPTKPGQPLLALKIVDFGLSGLMREGGLFPDQTAEVAEAYSAPQTPGDPWIGEQADVYALSVILLEMLTGAADGEQVVLPATAPALSGLPEAVSELLSRALSARSNVRFRSAYEMRAEVDRVFQSVSKFKVDVPAPTVAASLVRQADAAGIERPAPHDTGGDSLIVWPPEGAAQIFRLNKPVITVGRAESNDIVLQAETVSRKHLRLEQGSGGWTVTDLGSRNMTLLAANRLEPGRPYTWASGEDLSVGIFRLRRLPEVVEFPSAAMAATSADRMKEAGPIHLTVEPTVLRLTPGERAELEVEIWNPAEAGVECRLAVSGLPEEWVYLDQEILHLNPESREQVSLAIHPPRSSATRAERRAFEIRACRSDEAADMVSIPMRLTILVFVHYSTSLEPTLLREDGSCRVTVSNSGNTETTFNLRVMAGDESRQLQLDVAPSSLRIRPGSSGNFAVHVAARKRPWIGGGRAIRWSVQISSSGAGQQSLTGHYLLQPRISGRQLIQFIGLLLITLLFLALAFAILL